MLFFTTENAFKIKHRGPDGSGVRIFAIGQSRLALWSLKVGKNHVDESVNIGSPQWICIIR